MTNGRAPHGLTIAAATAVAAVAALASGGGAAGLTARAAAGQGEVPANGGSHLPALSADGRFVAFISWASNLVPGDTNHAGDVFVRDRLTHVTERVDVSSTGAQAPNYNEPSRVGISANGRFVVFDSNAPNLVAGDTNDNAADVFVHDRTAATTERVNVSSTGAQTPGSSSSFPGGISADGRFVVFISNASNLVSGDTNGVYDVFVRDRRLGTTERVSVSSTGAEGNGLSYVDRITPDGRFVAFSSDASNLVPGDTNGASDVFVRDRLQGTTERVSVSGTGAQASGGSDSPAISADGRFVAFASAAPNLVPGDTDGREDVFLHDRATGTTQLISVGDTRPPGILVSAGSLQPAISADGSVVAFTTDAPLVPGAANNDLNVFARNVAAGTTELVSAGQAIRSWFPAISGDGRVVAYEVGENSICSCETTDPDTTQVVAGDLGSTVTTEVGVGRDWAPKVRRVVLSPWPAHAGRRLSATLSVAVDGGRAPSAKVTCVALLARHRLRTAVRGFRQGSAHCAWQIPRTGRGDRLVVAISATTSNGTAARRLVAAVR